MERLTAVFDDEQIIVDGVARKVPGLSGSYQNLHAVQHDSSGTDVEYRDSQPNTEPSDGSLVADLHQRWKDEEPRTVYASDTGDPLTITVGDDIPSGYQASIPEAAAIENAKSRALRRVQQGYEESLSSLTAQYPALEREGWTKQESEARGFKNGTPSDLITLMATKRGLTEDEMADRIIAKAENYLTLYGSMTAQLHVLEEQIEAATTVSALDAIIWTED